MKNLKIIFFTSLSTVLIFSILFTYFYKDFLVDATVKQISDFNKKSGHSNSELVSLKSDSTSAQKQIITTDLRELANDKITNSRKTIITETVKKVSPAVVGINVTEIQQYRLDAFWRNFFGDRVYQKELRGIGSGIIISSDGYIITNDHVAGNAAQATVTLTDGRRFEAQIVGTDRTTDICLLKINETNLPHVQLGNSDDVLIGEWVIALGNPFGLFEINDKPTVTVGVISAEGMNLGGVDNRYYYNMIQTDAPINGGNSGGPLVNSIGELIGINTLIYTAQGSSGSVGVGFAIPINKVKKIISILKADGKVVRDFWTGLTIQPIDQAIAKYYKLKDTHGVIVSKVVNGSPADRAGLQVGDIIKKVDNYVINDQQSLIALLNNYLTNDYLQLTVTREAKEFKADLLLEKQKQ